MINEATIRKIVDELWLNTTINSSGLYNGKAGVALALFEAARSLEDESIENKAFDLFQECLIRTTNDSSFEEGLSGIGYLLIYLIRHRFIDADFDDIFNEQYKKIINDLNHIEKHPSKLLISSKTIYFLSALKDIHSENLQTNQIIEKIFRGIELYLSLQFFDWKDIHYINDKVYILQTFETYLKLIDFTGYKDFSEHTISSYANLYRSSRIASSLSIGYHLDKITRQNQITQYCDVIDSNISYGIKNIRSNLLSLDEKINLTMIIEDRRENYEDAHLIFIDLKEKSVEKIKKTIRANCPYYGYQYGLARYLIYGVNKNAVLT